MSENYIVINGKKAELTAEQMAALGIEPKKKNPFERVDCGDIYYIFNSLGEIQATTEDNLCYDQQLYDNANYFNDKDLAQMVNLQQLLYRKLLQYAYNTGTIDDQPWDGEAIHYCVYYDIKNKCFDVNSNCNNKGAHIYFNSRRGGERAIKEVIEPFMKDHPEFVW